MLCPSNASPAIKDTGSRFVSRPVPLRVSTKGVCAVRAPAKSTVTWVLGSLGCSRTPSKQEPLGSWVVQEPLRLVWIGLRPCDTRLTPLPSSVPCGQVLRGGQLLERIIQKDHYSEHEAARVAVQMISAVAYMHSVGVVHRDLKPENILYEGEELDSHIKLIDFGLSRCARDHDDDDDIGLCSILKMIPSQAAFIESMQMDWTHASSHVRSHACPPPWHLLRGMQQPL